MDRLADGADRLGEILDAVGRGHVARLEMDLGDAQIVAADEAVEDLGEKAALLAAEPAHDAEIDGDDPALGVDEKIALVHVGVEEAVAQGVAQERLDQRARQRWRIEPEFGRDAPGSASGDAVDPLHRHHFARRAVPVDRRRAKVGIVAARFSTNSDAAAASSRKSISIRTERASVSTTWARRKRRSSRLEALGECARRRTCRRGRAQTAAHARRAAL